MAIAAKQRRPSSQRSPTLSDAGMILPGFEADEARSTSPVFERPPSVSALYDAAYNSPKLGFPPQGRRRASQQKQSPPLSAQSSRSTLRGMGDSGAHAKRPPARSHVLASSPALDANGPQSYPAASWAEHEQRRLSTASSILSEDFENWPGFDSHEHFDDSGVDLEEQEKRDRPPRGPAKDDDDDDDDDDDMENEQWMNGRTSGSDDDDMDDPQSSAALSRRAELILANAKKRLNVMEGNLRGARESLVVSPTYNPIRSTSELSQHIASTRERDRRLYAGIGPIPPRTPSYHRNSLLYSNNSNTQGHTRGASETSIPLPFAPPYTSRMSTGKRASSAMGAASGPWSPEGFGHGRFPIKESRSHEVMRDPRSTWNSTDYQAPRRSTSRSSRSPSALETLREDESGHTLQRSASATSGLRDQMNDLKGRISSLKQRAQEDHMRRRSLQSLRTPSPFTSSEVWYHGRDGYQAGVSPVTQNAGLGIKTESSTRKTLYEDSGSPTTTYSQREGERLLASRERSPKGLGIQQAGVNPPSTIDEVTERSESTQGVEDTDNNDFVSVNGEELGPGGDSVYEDAVYEMPVTERHEDRLDAFDYEHFFLHSAMGTYSLEDRRSSISSDSSTATTRPVTAMQNGEDISNAEKRISIHQRNPSIDSISTVASFATAASHQSDEDDEDEEENEQMDQFAQQIISHNQQIASQRPSLVSLRSDSAINMRRGNGISPTQTAISRGSSRTSSSSGSLASGLQTSKIYSILTESASNEPRLAFSEEDKKRIYSLAASFQNVCANLQNTYGEQHDREAWRRRLDDARRVLAGEEVEEEQSF